MQIMSDQIDQLATSLAKAQSEMITAGKNQKNPFYKSTYADFESIINASRPALTKYGLSVVQSVSDDETGSSCLITILMHSSGQWIKSTAKHNPLKTDIQSLSSYNTYLKRMCYTSLVGVAVGEDDDGEAAVSNTRSNSSYNQREYSEQSRVVISSNIISEEDHAWIITLSPLSQDNIKEKYNVTDLRHLQKNDFNIIKSHIEKKRAEAQGKQSNF